MFKKGDIIVYLIIFSIIGLILVGGFNEKSAPGAHVEIYEDGRLAYRFSIHEEKKEHVVSSILGDEKIIIEKNSVRKTHATCPGKDCINHGEIKNAGEVIVCVPNKQVIKIVGKNRKDKEVDFILK